MNKILLTDNSIVISEEGVNRSTNVQELRTLFPVRRESLVLPNGTVRYSRLGVRQHFLLETPLQKRRIFLSNRSRNTVSMVWWPPSLWSIFLDEQGVMDIKVVFLNKSFHESDMSAEIYYSPYGNHYADTKICWNRMELPIIHKEMDIERVPSMFFDSIFNGDLRKRVLEDTGRLWTPSLGRMVTWGSQDAFLPTLLHEEGANRELRNQIARVRMTTLREFIETRDNEFKNNRQ